MSAFNGTPGPWLDWSKMEWLREPQKLLANTADARLIAAAPELLEALRESRTTLSILRTQIMVEIGRCADPSESRWAGVPEKLQERIAAIDAAIAAATGEGL